jgi:hypothetical protein
MGIQLFNDKIEQVGASKTCGQPIYGYVATTLANILGTQKAGSCMGILGRSAAMPSLDTGITGYYIGGTQIGAGVAASYILGKFVNLGSFDISGSGTYTDGSAMPTATILGVASSSYVSPIIVEVTSAITFTGSCNIKVDYTDQDGNSGSTAAIALTNNSPLHNSAFLTLASGDWGVRDITNVTRTGSPTSPAGVIKFWGVIPIGMIVIPTATVVAAKSGIGPLGLYPVKLGAGDDPLFSNELFTRCDGFLDGSIMGATFLF